jgi:hypothetical protein
MFAIFTALVFFNMSLVMAEICALELDKDRALIESIARVINGCAEEEAADGVADEDSGAKGLNIMIGATPTIPFQHLVESPRKINLQNHGIPRFGNYEIYLPPPEA